MLCIYCRREIREKERRYYSRQAGMKGLYHWDCFVEACHHANREGSYELESLSVNDHLLGSYSNSNYSFASE